MYFMIDIFKLVHINSQAWINREREELLITVNSLNLVKLLLLLHF